MNRSHRVWLLACCMAAIFCTLAHGELPPKDKPSLDDADRAAIQKFVAEQAPKLLDEKATAADVKAARDALIKGIKLDPNNPTNLASVPYRDEYANQVNKAFEQAPLSKASMRTRLNVAVVAGEVASVAQNARLLKTLLALLNDPSEPVVLWAVKGASGVMPARVKISVQAALPLLSAVEKAVHDHPTGLVYIEAYRACIETCKVAKPDEAAPLIKSLIKLLQARVNVFKGQLADEPLADYAPASFLVTDVWCEKGNRDPQIVQLVSDMVFLLAQHVDNPKLPPEKRTTLSVYATKMWGGLALVIGDNAQNASLSAAATRYRGAIGELAPQAELVCHELEKAYKTTPPPKFIPIDTGPDDAP